MHVLIFYPHPSRRGYHAMLTDVFSPCLVRLKINCSGIPGISSLYILWAGRICPCMRRTWVVPSMHRRRATEVQTCTPPYGTWPVARRTNVEGAAKARRQYVERAFTVGFSACDSVRRRHGGRKRRALPVRWLQNHFQTPISRRRRRIWDVTPPQHQTRKSRSTYGGLWPRHNYMCLHVATVYDNLKNVLEKVKLLHRTETLWLFEFGLSYFKLIAHSLQ